MSTPSSGPQRTPNVVRRAQKPYLRPQSAARGPVPARKPSTFFDSIKNIVSLPLTWLSGKDDVKPGRDVEEGKARFKAKTKRRVSNARDAAPDGPPRSAKKSRMLTPPRAERGYLDPPPAPLKYQLSPPLAAQRLGVTNGHSASLKRRSPAPAPSPTKFARGSPPVMDVENAHPGPKRFPSVRSGAPAFAEETFGMVSKSPFRRPSSLAPMPALPPSASHTDIHPMRRSASALRSHLMPSDSARVTRSSLAPMDTRMYSRTPPAFPPGSSMGLPPLLSVSRNFTPFGRSGNAALLANNHQGEVLQRSGAVVRDLEPAAGKGKSKRYVYNEGAIYVCSPSWQPEAPLRYGAPRLASKAGRPTCASQMLPIRSSLPPRGFSWLWKRLSPGLRRGNSAVSNVCRSRLPPRV
ncbi:hypothetical protein BOTBODRAFT_397157 [Botryobasidium botryosum FD-172 SS1]|uniref:Uncharacterized protein n=1 Tax=Botryobasidium botryosum (strain FD-172 SS1) TaxID=930990 RepID=A0A067MEN4_BOTB1|nr:hypothetical protein BOTBODRAFT_397157 [Botryobasidium botryosum FD-172 SS1]